MSAAALKVVSSSPAAPHGRQNLVAALARREETLARYVAASASVDRLRSLIDAETLARSALDQLEQKSAEGAASWARGETVALDLPPDEEIDAARREVVRASRLADAARAALLGINAQVSGAAAAHSASVGDVISAIHELLYVEAAKIRSRQLAAEAEAARCCEELICLSDAFKSCLMPGDVRGSAVLSYRNSINGAIDPLRMRAEPRSMAPREDLAAKYIDFAARLAGDPTAALA